MPEVKPYVGSICEGHYHIEGLDTDADVEGEGSEMLARQGAEQVEIWLGRSVSLDRLRREGLAALARRRESIVLVGMRGAGKTTVGRALAACLGREFVDLDDEVEVRAGMGIPEIFEREGEPRFREREVEALGGLIGRPDLVLALGGGAPATAAVRETVRSANARVVWLDAPPEVLARRIAGSGRPALTELPLKEEVERLAEERRGHYESLAEFRFDTAEAPPDEVAERILDRLDP